MPIASSSPSLPLVSRLVCPKVLFDGRVTIIYIELERPYHVDRNPDRHRVSAGQKGAA